MAQAAARVGSSLSFDALVDGYPSPMRYSPGAVKRLIGGAVDDTKKGATPWLGGEQGDTCTIRMSRAFNRAGHFIPAHLHFMRTVRGADGLNYAFAVQEFHRYLLLDLGEPDILVKGKPVDRQKIAGKKGVILFDINFGLNPDGQTRAMGHVDLWDGQTFFDEISGQSDPQGRDFFKIATAVSLWICQGNETLPRV